MPDVLKAIIAQSSFVMQSEHYEIKYYCCKYFLHFNNLFRKTKSNSNMRMYKVDKIKLAWKIFAELTFVNDEGTDRHRKCWRCPQSTLMQRCVRFLKLRDKLSSSV